MKIHNFYKTWRAFIKLWREREKLADRNLSTNLRDFLPPALEVVEKPANPVAGWFLRLIILIVFTALIWSVFGKVDIVSVADGKIIPAGKVKEIQPYDHGMIKAILVREGQRVEEGQALIELDGTQTEAEEKRLLAEKSLAEGKRKRVLALIDLLEMPMEETAVDETLLSHPALEGDRKNGRLLLEKYKTIIFQRRSLESQIKEQQAEWERSQVLVRQYTENIPLAKQRLAAMKGLYEKKATGLNDYMSSQIYYNEQIYGLEAEGRNSSRLMAAIDSGKKQLASQTAQVSSETLEELNELNRQLETIDQELNKIRDLASKQILFAPVKGTVKGLQTNTIGGVVSSAQVLMEIVPLGETLMVEAFLGNQDIGYVRDGQASEIKVATFPFTKYGVIAGRVDHVAEDATVDEKLGLIYRVLIKLEKNSILVNGKEEPLLPGMAVSAEINTDKRRLIEYILSPIIRMKDESLRER
jgi:hemolysin D